MTIVDSHLHVWSDDPRRYPWSPLTGFGPATIPGSLELLVNLMDRSGVDRAVLVQPSNYGYEHGYLLDSIRRFPDRLIGVCLADPEDPRAPEILERRDKEGFGGLRLRPLSSPSWAWLNAPSTYPLWEKAGELGVPINFLIRPYQFRALEGMVAKFPQVRVIVDPLGSQRPDESPDYPSADGLLRLADYPNTYVKASSLSTNSKQLYPHPDAIGLVRRVYERFGARRMLWGSDYPYVQTHEGYARALALVDQYTFMTDEDRRWLRGKTALTLYGFTG